jgi:hypothetical protein
MSADANVCGVVVVVPATTASVVWVVLAGAVEVELVIGVVDVGVLSVWCVFGASKDAVCIVTAVPGPLYAATATVPDRVTAIHPLSIGPTASTNCWGSGPPPPSLPASVEGVVVSVFGVGEGVGEVEVGEVEVEVEVAGWG